MSYLLALLTALGVLASADFLVRLARIESLAEYPLAVMTAGAVVIVLQCELLSIFGLLTGSALTIISLALLLTRLVFEVIRSPNDNGFQLVQEVVRCMHALPKIRVHASLALLIGLVIAAYAIQLGVGVLSAANDYDSLAYHLSRAAYWLQYQSAGHFPGGTRTQLGHPPNAELLLAWILGVTRSDRLAESVEWLCIVGTAIGVYALARLAAYETTAALFAAALFLAMPQPLLQATTGQNDGVVSFFIVVAAVFGIIAYRNRAAGALALATTACGLALGTKGTALIAAVAAILVVVIVARPRPSIRVVCAVPGAVLVAAALLGGYNYVLNLRDTGNPLGRLPVQVSADSVRSNPAVDMMRVGWTLVDVPQAHRVPWLEDPFRAPTRRLFAGIERSDFDTPQALDKGVAPATSAYGAIGMLFLIPIIAFHLFAGRSRVRRALAAFAALYFIGLVVATGYNPWVARLLLPAVAVSSPLLGTLYRLRLARWAAVLVATLTVTPVVLLNPHKALWGSESIFRTARAQQQSANDLELARALHLTDQTVGSDGAIGYVGDEESLDYPFFGAGRRRRVVRLKEGEGTVRTMMRLHLRGIVFAENRPSQPRVQRVRHPRGAPGIQLSRYYFLALPVRSR